MKWYPPELCGRVFVVDVAPLGTLLARYFSTEEYEGMPEARDDSSDDGVDGGGWEDGDDEQGDGGHEDGDDGEEQEEVNGGEDDEGDGEWVGNTRWKP